MSAGQPRCRAAKDRNESPPFHVALKGSLASRVTVYHIGPGDISQRFELGPFGFTRPVTTHRRHSGAAFEIEKRSVCQGMWAYARGRFTNIYWGAQLQCPGLGVVAEP